MGDERKIEGPFGYVCGEFPVGNHVAYIQVYFFDGYGFGLFVDQYANDGCGGFVLDCLVVYAA